MFDLNLMYSVLFCRLGVLIVLRLLVWVSCLMFVIVLRIRCIFLVVCVWISLIMFVFRWILLSLL